MRRKVLLLLLRWVIIIRSYWRYCWAWLRPKFWVVTVACFAGAPQAVEVSKYAIAVTLFIASALSLMFVGMGWLGIAGHPWITRVGRSLLVCFCLILIPVTSAWVLKQKGSEPWTVFLRSVPHVGTVTPVQVNSKTSQDAERRDRKGIVDKRSPVATKKLDSIGQVAVPEIALTTQHGLVLSDFSSLSISEDMMRHLRRHVLSLRNLNPISLQNIVLRFQLPEPVIGKLIVEDQPAGIEVTWHACRISFALAGDGASATTIPPTEVPGSVQAQTWDQWLHSTEVEKCAPQVWTMIGSTLLAFTNYR